MSGTDLPPPSTHWLLRNRIPYAGTKVAFAGTKLPMLALKHLSAGTKSRYAGTTCPMLVLDVPTRTRTLVLKYRMILPDGES
eukprot:232067-Rhodomonas_salina.2